MKNHCFVLFLVLAGCASKGETPESNPVKSMAAPQKADATVGISDTKAASAGMDYDFPTHAAACRGTGQHTVIAPELRCTRDSQCGVCHDGSSCGTVMLLSAILKRGAACEKKDSAACELFGVHCCGGKCINTAMSGDCKKGGYWVKGKCY
ncbi:hypothetical protein KKF84_07170 [Myxococcota bacterium]|nr:hypothetical protein [Myxococcota bacterium]MBU1535083.1 hypothetical protein [Myxococcota bacterium]